MPDSVTARPRWPNWRSRLIAYAGLRSARRRSLRNEWLMLLALIVAAALLLSGNDSLRVPNRLLYDHMMATLSRPAPDNVVIIVIDDKSIAELGRWPWKRGIHAQLLNVLSTGAPRAVGLDIVLTEGDPVTVGGDRALVNALLRNRRTILPILTTQTDMGPMPQLPDAGFAEAAAGLAHIQLNFSDDGIVRSSYLHHQLDGQEWKALALAMLEDVGSQGSVAVRPNLMRIPFFGPPGHFTRVSYIDVLRGTVPARFFRDKYVLVGASASGLGDVFPTPQARQHGLMSGIELHANILGALLEGRSIDIVPRAASVLFAIVPALLVLIGFLYLSPRYALILTGALTLVIGATCYVLLQHDIWLAPSAALLLLWLSYPVWSWRRLEVALRYLNEETERLAHSAPFAVTPAHPHGRRLWDFLERRIDAARTATHRMLDLHQFVSDNLNSMPDANLVIDCDAHLMLFNRQAQQLFASLGTALARGQQLPQLLTPLQLVKAQPAGAVAWLPLLAQAGSSGVEAIDTQQRIFIIRATPSQQADGAMLGWIVSLADVTALRATERLRDDSLNFISHDMRAPQSSILATLELQRSGQIALDQEALFQRIEKSVYSTLGLAEDFILLARAEARSYHLQELDLGALLADAVDDMWALANDRRVRLQLDIEGAPYWIRGDRTMLVRVLCNLISNAIKYGPEGGHVRCSVEQQGDSVRCLVRDDGPGLSETDLRLLFTPFYRAGKTQQAGAGLGLAFVRTVVQHHGGRVTAMNQKATNQDSGGACFVVELPAAPEQSEEPEEPAA